ncbi:MAG: class I SAM-dependent methyltransferase [Rubrobacteraceae bacterium]
MMSSFWRKTKGHRIFAALYDRLNAAAEKGWQGERRSRLLSGITGEVLEIGGGTGANLPHYRAAERVVVTEPDPFMRDKLRPKLSQARVPVEILESGAQELPFADDSFDAVVSTLVLCSVPDQRSALAEIRRVLRPEGTFIFMEHVRGSGRAARWQDRIEPLWTRLFAGCHPNRDTVAAIEAAGFRLEDFERFDPPVPLSGFVPHVQGTAKVPVGS